MGWFLGSLPKDIWRLLIRTWLPKCDLAHLREAIFPRDIARIADIAESIVENHHDNLVDSRVLPNMKGAHLSVRKNLVLAAVRTGDKSYTDRVGCVLNVLIGYDMNFKSLYVKEAARLTDDEKFFQFVLHFTWTTERILPIVKGPKYIERVKLCNPYVDYEYLGFLVRQDCLELFQLFFKDPWNDVNHLLSLVFDCQTFVHIEKIPFECKKTLEWIVENHSGIWIPEPIVKQSIWYATPNTWQWLFKLFPILLDVSIVQEVRQIENLEFFHSYHPIFPFSLEACERFLNFRAQLDELVWLMQRHETPVERLEELKELMEQDPSQPENVERFWFLLTSPQ